MSNTRKAKSRTPQTTPGTQTAEAGRAEVEGVETVIVTWRDLTPFEVPRFRFDWPFEAVLAAEDERYPAMIAALLPPKTRAEFASMRCTTRDAYMLMNAISDAMGFEDPGESSASTD